MTRVLIRSNQPAGKGGDERREQMRDDEDKWRGESDED